MMLAAEWAGKTPRLFRILIDVSEAVLAGGHPVVRNSNSLRKHMNQSQPKNPLHGITLKTILEYLVAEYGWEKLGDRIKINCFHHEPTINSSLKFLRKTEWAREKVETLYLYSVSYDKRHGKQNADADEIQNETDCETE